MAVKNQPKLVKKKDNFIFMIENDGQFSSGGCRPHFGKSGKMWTRMGNLKSHLLGVIDALWFNKYDDAEIVIYKLVEVERKTVENFVGRYLDEMEFKQPSRGKKYKEKIQQMKNR